MRFIPRILALVTTVVPLVAAATSTAVLAAPQGAPRRGGPVMAPASDIVETARGGKFNTLVAALDAAGLATALKGEGPFTVFAPTDEAFAALPKGTLESLLKPENIEELRTILTHHVVPGRLLSYEIGNIDDPQMARTASGARLPVGVDRRGFRFGDANVIDANVRCSNGVIHVIDRVVLPKAPRSEEAMKMAMKEAAPASLLDALRAVPDGRFSTFLAAVEASGGDQDWALPEPVGNWTVFVPTNDAFARLSEAERAALLDPTNREMLRAILDWHALPELQTWSFDFNDGERGPVMISREKGRFVLDVVSNGMVFVYRLRSAGVPRDAEEPFKARIVAGDIQVGGSVVHVVDRVMLPPGVENVAVASQAYREKDVEELAMGGFAQFRGKLALNDLVARAESLDDDAAIELYQFGLRLLEDVIRVSRTGMMLMPDEGRTKREALENKLRARIGDLDRVWYAMFMRNSPTATSLADPLPSTMPAAPRTQAANTGTNANANASVRVDTNRVAIAVAQPEAAVSTNVTDTIVTSTVNTVAAPPAWCEVVAQQPDPAVVTDAPLRDAIVRTGLPWHVRDRASGIEMLLVPPGQFMMGKSAGDAEAMSNEVPAHPVTITKPYYLGRYEVTRAQWAKVQASNTETAAKPGSDRRASFTIEGEQGGMAVVRQVGDDNGIATVEVGTPGGGGVTIVGGAQLVDQQGNPVRARVTTEPGPAGTIIINTVAVRETEDADMDGKDAESGQTASNAANDRSLTPQFANYTQAAAFSKAIGMRLPTEAEWEYACRAGVSASRYGELDVIAWHRDNCDRGNKPVGTKAANALGFHDMLGNAWEWVNDWYSEYTRAPKTDPTGPASGDSRIVRGSFFNDPGGFCRSSLRYDINAFDFADQIGFRVARNP
jgi:transforming growth factor-beta-induced protein